MLPAGATLVPVKTVGGWMLALLVVIGAGVGVEAGIGVGGSGAVVGYQAVGKVCGVTALAGGPKAATGVKDTALLRVCPSGPARQANFSLAVSTGKLFEVSGYQDGGWYASLPAGTYRAVGRPGCRQPGPPFVVTAGKTLLGVVVWWGCLYK